MITQDKWPIGYGMVSDESKQDSLQKIGWLVTLALDNPKIPTFRT